MARSSFRSAYGLSLKKTDEERERKRREQIFALAKEHGLKTPEEEPKENIPLLARVFDITSRLEYGISQSIIEQKEAATKSFQERVIAGPKGFIAGITGKKKARAEDVLKKLGIGEAPLITTPKVTTPNIPFLGKLTFGGKITGRGLASLPLSIVADPITYLSIGTGSAAKLTLKNGATVALNKPGRTALTNEIKQVIKQSTKEGTELSGMQVRELAERKIRDLIEASPKKYVDFGGIKFAGKTILPEAQQKIGRKVAETGIPERVKEITARTLAPIVPGAKLKAQGYGDFFERVRDTQRQPNLIRKGSVEQAIDFFQKETGKMPSQAQLEEFFDLADKGLPIPKVRTPILTEIEGELPETFAKTVDKVVTDPTVNSLYKRYLTDIRPALRGMALDLGLPEDKLLHDYIFRGIAGKEKKATTGIVSPFKLKKPSQLKARTAPEFTGIEKNPVFAIAQSLAELRVASVNNRFITETLEKYGIKKAKGALIPEGFIEYQPKGALGFFPVTTDAGKNVAAVTKKVPTYYVPEEIGKTLNKLTSTTDVHSFLKLYDKTLRIWKGGVTSLFPAFHIRNWTGNIYNNWLGGVNDIDSYVDALKLQSGRDISVMGFSKHELRDSLEELGIVRTGFYGKDIESLLDDVLKTEATDTSKLIRALTKTKTLKEKTLDPVISFPRAIGTVIEDNGKIAHFVSKLKQGLSPREAAASVRKYLFDYTDLTDFEKQVMRRIIPFYTWIRKDIPLQIESLVRTPGKPAAVGDIINALPKGDKSDLGGLPDYIKEGFFVSLGAGKFAYSLSTLPI